MGGIYLLTEMLDPYVIREAKDGALPEQTFGWVTGTAVDGCPHCFIQVESQEFLGVLIKGSNEVILERG